MSRQEKWDYIFLELAKFWADACSKDPSTKVGSVIARDVNDLVSLGYNGFNSNDPDLPKHYNDRLIKYKKIIHAERNAIDRAEKNGYANFWGCTIYTAPFQPCDSSSSGAGCTDLIISKGFSRVVSYRPTEAQSERWGESFDSSRAKLEQAGIELVLYDQLN
jgi:deoxycytidylate deaminase